MSWKQASHTIRQRAELRLVPLLLSLLLIAMSAGATGDGLQAEIERLRELAADDSLGDNVKHVRKAVQEAESAAGDGRVHLAAERLRRALIFGEALAYQARKKQEIEDPEAFAAEWRAQSDAFDHAKNDANGVCRAAPSHLRALAEATWNQAPVYYQAAGAMVPAASVEGGLFYLGQALGSAKITAWCEMAMSVTRTPPAVSSLGRELAELELATEREYARPGAAIDKHSSFIRLNATIKQLRELEGRGLLYGALYEYLDASLQLALVADAEISDDRTVLTQRATSLAARLDAASTDHGIAAIFLERAAAALADEEAETDDLTAAGVILNQILPAYFEIVGASES